MSHNEAARPKLAMIAARNEEKYARAAVLFSEGFGAAEVADHVVIGLRTAYTWRKRWLKSYAAHGGVPRAARVDTSPPPPLPETPVDTSPPPPPLPETAVRIRALELELSKHRKDAITKEAIRRTIVHLSDDVAAFNEPPWTATPSPTVSDSPGVPTLFVSDLHWGEVVNPHQIGGVNSYDMATANARLKRLADTSIHLLRIIDPRMNYPGIVIPLGGDMVSGNIHDELVATNEMNTMPVILDLFGALTSFITLMADTFGNVFLPCVSGNHGRDTHKIWAKDRNHTSFDWLLYCFLAKRFEANPRVKFYIPDGSDALYRIYGHRYLLTHGDQFRGGDGMIGALGPIIRGDHKKRSRNTQIGMSYDTMIMGHWHQYIHHGRVLVNGSLKGYDEYASQNNFGFEPPQQALWLTHPKYRITYRMPVYVSDPLPTHDAPWVSLQEGL